MSTSNSIIRDGDVARIVLPARFDFVTSADYRVTQIKLMADPTLAKIVVDCAQLDYIDSMGIGVLIAWQERSQALHKKMQLAGCSPKIVKVLKTTGVAALFTFV